MSSRTTCLLKPAMADTRDSGEPYADDRARVEQLLGRPPAAAFDVVVRDESGDPVVIRRPHLGPDFSGSAQSIDGMVAGILNE